MSRKGDPPAAEETGIQGSVICGVGRVTTGIAGRRIPADRGAELGISRISLQLFLFRCNQGRCGSHYPGPIHREEMPRIRHTSGERVMRTSCRRFISSLIPFVLAACIPFSCAEPMPAPPGQPETGPGSSAAVASKVRTTTLGEKGLKVLVYEPDGVELNSAPVIVFLHGYGGINPRFYGGWIKHLVYRGNIVIFPVYQDSLGQPQQYTANALAAVQNAFALLQSEGHVAPDPERFAIVGHSLGGTIAMNLAAVAHTSGLPPVRALLAANAGDTTSKTSLPSIQTGNYDQIPADMLFLGVVCEYDDIVGDETVLGLYNSLQQIPSANREVVESIRTTTALRCWRPGIVHRCRSMPNWTVATGSKRRCRCCCTSRKATSVHRAI